MPPPPFPLLSMYFFLKEALFDFECICIPYVVLCSSQHRTHLQGQEGKKMGGTKKEYTSTYEMRRRRGGGGKREMCTGAVVLEWFCSVFNSNEFTGY